ncbi:MAG TPA: oligopeptide ABC transporter ATP-binding protein, partial [bacterium]|nr:oligopeptide ABC transporter ATP-binding protein [bacterium]
ALTRELLSDPLHPYTNALLNAIPEPDPENRNIIKEVPPGEPPDLVNPPPGCRFAPRCARVMDLCKEKPPELEIKERHWVKCWLYK